jgi:pimeloyl-ACP methyl ester carboxylesterase
MVGVRDAHPLPTGGAVRFTGPLDGPVLVCANGGVAREVPGDWSPTVEWLVGRLAPRFPGVGFAEVRYRVKSWRRLPGLVADGLAALDATRAAGATRLAMLGFSAGGAVALACAAARPEVERVIALAPWIPGGPDLGRLAGRRVAVMHGTLDGIPGVPGTSPRAAALGVERMRALGVDASFTPVPGGVHGLAVRPMGTLVRLPRAGRWEDLVAAEVEDLLRVGAAASAPRPAAG